LGNGFEKRILRNEVMNSSLMLMKLPSHNHLPPSRGREDPLWKIKENRPVYPIITMTMRVLAR
jgi:hypothetical protein